LRLQELAWGRCLVSKRLCTASSSLFASTSFFFVPHHPPHPQGAESILKQEYKEGCNLKEALLLAVKVLNKTMDSTSLTSDRRRFWGLDQG
jgi:hypothetical protein